MVVYSEGVYKTSTDAGATLFTVTSTEEEKKHVNKLEITNVITHPALLTVFLEREKVIDTFRLEKFDVPYRENSIPLDVDIPVGRTLTGILTSASSGNHGVVTGAIEYTIE